MGPNNWGIFLILPVTTGEGIGPAGEISPVVCMLKNALLIIIAFCSILIFANYIRFKHKLYIARFILKVFGDLTGEETRQLMTSECGRELAAE